MLNGLRRFGHIASILTAIFAAGESLSAQAIRGTVTAVGTNAPVTGVVLSLFDTTGRVIARALTTQSGRFVILEAKGATRLRAQRIGYAAVESALPTDGGRQDISIRMTPLATMLAPVKVLASPRCPSDPRRAGGLALMEQARAGLLAAAVTGLAIPSRIERISYVRRFELGSDRPDVQRIWLDSSRIGAATFVSGREPAALVSEGFREEVPSGSVFTGPDVAFLMDDAFSDGYCFSLADRDRSRPGEVGVSFSAAARRSGRVDIAGTIWIDTAARQLREIEYEFVGVGDGQSIDPGGQTFFREMPNGMVVSDRWIMRTPVFSPEADGMRIKRELAGRKRPAEVKETGGRLARIEWPDGQSWKASLGSVRVVAMNADGSAAAGHRLGLLGTDYNAIVDSAGTLSISDVLPGTYQLIVIDPGFPDVNPAPTPLASLQVRSGDSATARVRVRPYATLAATRCSLPTGHSADRWVTSDSGLVLLGKVMDVDFNEIEDAEVRYRLAGESGSAFKRTDSNGVFAICLPKGRLGQVVELSASAPSYAAQGDTASLTGHVVGIRLILKR